MAQIINITSEALQAVVRRLLPSQQGFGEDLQATNVITPIIDLTPTAEGSVLPTSLQQALAFGSSTAFSETSSSSTIINNAGFFRVTGVASVKSDASFGRSVSIRMTDGLSTKTLYSYVANAGIDDQYISETFDFVFYLNAGESISVNSSAGCTIAGSSRQVATATGELVNPVGYVSQ